MTLDTGMNDSTVARRRPWPKLHLIYFLLAAFDLIAVGGGLYLSHQLSAIYEASAATNEEWSGRFSAIWKLSDLASEVNAPANNIFQSQAPDVERQKLEAAASRFSAAVDAVRAEIASNVPATMASHPLKTLTYIDQAMAAMVSHGERTLFEYDRGDIEKAAHSMGLMDRGYDVLKRRLDDSLQSVREIQSAHAARYGAAMQELKRFEYIIGGAIALMVLGVVLYGHWVGSFITRKYRELEAAHGASLKAEAESLAIAQQLQTINGDVVTLNRQLESNLTELRDAQDELLRKNRLAQLGQLTATIAHEIRNPLGSVRTAAYLIERRIKGSGLGVEPQLQRISNGITRCDSIITQLLEFSRSRALQTQLTVLDDWLAALVAEEAGKMLELIHIECDLGLGALKLHVDPARLSRALINMIANAAEAMTGQEAPRIAVTSSHTARGIEISVADNGPGIRPELLEKIREPLFTTKSFGTGLGIPAVEQIVSQHGGRLDIVSAPAKGAVFTIILPYDAAEMQEETLREAV